MKFQQLTPALSIVVGVVILIWPSVLAYAVALYFIVSGALELSRRR